MKVRRMRRYLVMKGPPHAKGAERKMCEAPMSKWCWMNSRYTAKYCEVVVDRGR